MQRPIHPLQSNDLDRERPSTALTEAAVAVFVVVAVIVGAHCIHQAQDANTHRTQ
jgi:hypothetical protein